MKKTFTTFFISLLIALSFSSCFEKNENEYRYYPVQRFGSEMWSIIDLKTGEFVCKDEFRSRPTQICNDRFFVENEDNGTFDCFSIKDINKPINKDKYVSVTPFSDGFAWVGKEGETLSLIDENCKVIKQMNKDIVECQKFNEGLSAFRTSKDKFGYVDKTGKIVVDAIYDYVGDFRDGVGLCEKHDKKKGITNIYALDKTGKELFKFTDKEYDNYCHFENGYMAVKKGSVIEFIDKTGKKVFTNSKFENKDDIPYYFNFTFDGEFFIFAEGNLFGLKDKKNEIVVRAKYDHLESIDGGLFIAVKDEKYGVVDSKDKTIIDFEYESISCLKKDVYLVERDEKYAIVNGNGEDVSKENFEDAGCRIIYRAFSNFIDANEYAKKIKDCFTKEVFNGEKVYSKDLTLNDFKDALIYKAEEYVDQYLLPYPAFSITEGVSFSTPIASEKYEYFYGYRFPDGYRFNFNSKITTVAKMFDVSNFATTTEKKIAKAFDELLVKDGYTLLEGFNHTYSSGQGTFVSLGYKAGEMILAYSFDSKYALDMYRTERKTKIEKNYIKGGRRKFFKE